MTLLEVARIGRAHGIHGEVAVTLISDRTERLDPGTELLSDRGTLEVVTSRPHGRTWLVRFSGVEDRNAAEALSGSILKADVDDPDEGIWVHQVVGLDVVDVAGGRHGQVVAVQRNPAHDLLVLDDDTLVPAVFIVSVDEEIVVDAPDGLFT